MLRNEDDHALIEAAASSAYNYVAELHGLDPAQVHRLRQCRPVTGHMAETLRAAGLSVEPVSRGGWVVDEHRYLRLGSGVVDATWQQFLPEDVTNKTGNLPKVYVGPPADLQSMAALHGADPAALHLWDPTGPGPIRSVQERIAEAIDRAPNLY